MSPGKFKAYIGDPDFHDGVVVRIRRASGQVDVEVEGYSGTHYLVLFDGVTSVMTRNPEGMVLYALTEMEADGTSRHFVFANSREADQEGGESALEIEAREFTVRRIVPGQTQ
ncbi:MAG TPA: hypothetical protein VFO39_18695 [Candidatus Sulfotelmatobacter sp.]|nr:hypothetical protein [Candidatus Sulfotelmatobacter sp.]